MKPSMYRMNLQRGAVLFVALIFLLVLTVLALAATSSSIMQERMTGGMRNRQLSMLGVESTLRGGEELLWTLSFDARQPLPPCLETGGSADCVYRPLPSGLLMSKAQAFRTSKEWIDSSEDGGRDYLHPLETLDDDDVTAKLAVRPRYIIEDIGPDLPPSTGQQVGAVNPETTSLVGKRQLYRITARSQGGSGSFISIAESVYSAMDLTNAGFNPDAAP